MHDPRPDDDENAWLDHPTDTSCVVNAAPVDGANVGSWIDDRFVEALEDYELLGEIARGGMGIVFRARQRSLNRLVALKVIVFDASPSDDDIARFRREAESAAQLHHPTIVNVHDFGEAAGLPYFSMDLISGESLATRLICGPLDAREAATLLRRVADGVQHAHDRQIIHRDLKPANILLDETGFPRITDFGIACRASESASGTEYGAAAGTPGYMAPEQVDGAPTTPATDVYSLGAVFYATLTGRAPFLAATPFETMAQVVERDPAPPRALNASVPADLESIVLKCLRKAPRERFATARDFAADLDRFLRGEAVMARRGDALYFALRWVRRNLVLASVSSVVAGVLTAFAAIMAVAYRHELSRRTTLERELIEEQSRTAVAREHLRRQISLNHELREQLPPVPRSAETNPPSEKQAP